MNYSADEEARMQSYAKVHLRSKTDLPHEDKIIELNKRLKTKWIQLVINVAIIVVFGYMFLRGYTTFSDIFYYVLFGLFFINVVLIFLQRRQINELISYLEFKAERGG
jgi:hypothetical protein